MSSARTQVLPIPRRRPDPIGAAMVAILVLLVAWSAAPMATAALGSESSDTRIELEVPITTSVTPGWIAGDTNVRLPNLSAPGDPQDVTSPGWKLSTNWVNGYEVRIRATTDPALRGVNAVDGAGVRSSFADYRAATCPCPWTGSGYEQGIFGYSVSVSSTGDDALDTEKWGTSNARRWRGFTTNGYRAYATPGGTGQHTMSIHFRSMIPDGTVQPEGSYRAGLVVSAHPVM